MRLLPRYCAIFAVAAGLVSVVSAEQIKVPKAKDNPDLAVVTWVDNLTYGGINTLVGLPLILVGSGYDALVNRKAPELKVDATGYQLRFKSALFSKNRSFVTGLIHHNNKSGGHGEEAGDLHERGHALQSAALGLAFYPFIGLSYLAARSTEKNIAEDWANAWYNLEETLVNSHPLQLRFESGEINKKTIVRAGANFAILERASRREFDEGRSVQIAYRYGDVGLEGYGTTRELAECTSVAPLKLDASILQKKFLGEWATVSSAVRLLVDSEQETGAISIDLQRGRLDTKFLSQVLGVGLRLGEREKLAFDITGRVSGNVKGLWYFGANPESPTSPGAMAAGGAGGEARVYIADWAQIYAQKFREWGTGGYRRDLDVIGTETPMLFSAKSFSTVRQNGKPVPVFGGIKYQRENESFPGANGLRLKTEIKMTVFTLGGRF